MGEKTNIEWCDSTASPWTGCTKVSPGCANCYAADLAKRYGWCEWGPGKPRHKFKSFAENCRKWNHNAYCRITLIEKRPKIFPSLCDPWDEEVPIELLAEFLQVIHECHNLDFLLLTKRPENFTNLLLKVGGLHSVDVWGNPLAQWLADWHAGKAPANVWIGVSVEDQQRADERIPELLKIPARVRFLSCEPLLGPIDFGFRMQSHRSNQAVQEYKRQSVRSNLQLVIVGGESGPKSRPCDIRWIRSIVTQCKQANVPCYVKQLGSRPVGHSWNPEFSIYIDHPKGGDPEEWPEDLRVREMPV